MAATGTGDGQQPSDLPSQSQLLAALRVIFGGQGGGDSLEPFWLLLLHHLDLSGIQVCQDLMRELLHARLPSLCSPLTDFLHVPAQLPAAATCKELNYAPDGSCAFW